MLLTKRIALVAATVLASASALAAGSGAASAGDEIWDFLAEHDDMAVLLSFGERASVIDGGIHRMGAVSVYPQPQDMDGERYQRMYSALDFDCKGHLRMTPLFVVTDTRAIPVDSQPQWQDIPEKDFDGVEAIACASPDAPLPRSLFLTANAGAAAYLQRLRYRNVPFTPISGVLERCVGVAEAPDGVRWAAWSALMPLAPVDRRDAFRAEVARRAPAGSTLVAGGCLPVLSDDKAKESLEQRLAGIRRPKADTQVKLLFDGWKP